MVIYLLTQCYLSLKNFLFRFASTDDRTVGRHHISWVLSQFIDRYRSQITFNLQIEWQRCLLLQLTGAPSQSPASNVKTAHEIPVSELCSHLALPMQPSPYTSTPPAYVTLKQPCSSLAFLRCHALTARIRSSITKQSILLGAVSLKSRQSVQILGLPPHGSLHRTSQLLPHGSLRRTS